MESLVLFDSVVNSRWFMRTSIILFLNKIDLFREKLGRSPLGNYFPDYSGGNDINRAAKYLLWRFNQVNRAHLNLYPQCVRVLKKFNSGISWLMFFSFFLVLRKLPIQQIFVSFLLPWKKQSFKTRWKILAFYDFDDILIGFLYIVVSPFVSSSAFSYFSLGSVMFRIYIWLSLVCRRSLLTTIIMWAISILRSLFPSLFRCQHNLYYRLISQGRLSINFWVWNGVSRRRCIIQLYYNLFFFSHLFFNILLFNVFSKCFLLGILTDFSLFPPTILTLRILYHVFFRYMPWEPKVFESVSQWNCSSIKWFYLFFFSFTFVVPSTATALHLYMWPIWSI